MYVYPYEARLDDVDMQTRDTMIQAIRRRADNGISPTDDVEQHFWNQVKTICDLDVVHVVDEHLLMFSAVLRSYRAYRLNINMSSPIKRKLAAQASRTWLAIRAPHC